MKSALDGWTHCMGGRLAVASIPPNTSWLTQVPATSGQIRTCYSPDLGRNGQSWRHMAFSRLVLQEIKSRGHGVVKEAEHTKTSALFAKFSICSKDKLDGFLTTANGTTPKKLRIGGKSCLCCLCK